MNPAHADMALRRLRRMNRPRRPRQISPGLATAIAAMLCAAALAATNATAQTTRSASGGSIAVAVGPEGAQVSSGDFRIDASRGSWGFQLTTPGFRFYNSGVAVDGGAFQCAIANAEATAVRCNRVGGASGQPYAYTLLLLDVRGGGQDPVDSPNAWIQNR